jgi:activator of HSP90 ATPase
MPDYRYKITIKESAEIIFSAMTNPVTLELWTGYPAVMEPAENAEFSLWDGDINGKNLLVEVNKKLVQQWYFDDGEPPSIVTVLLIEVNDKTRIELTHTNIPEEAFENISTGWKEYYFKPLKKFLES